ncbi:hypothetical protein T05_144 [Trichinella murrelli]|uniref:Uncharacterized protein n=1 Tax=Trichinella murrelli TaxID=144512 RepID=A0A0V0UGN0_9BILA|nr:hypothetical protein T05_144 [Trichinella murrelli]
MQKEKSWLTENDKKKICFTEIRKVTVNLISSQVESSEVLPYLKHRFFIIFSVANKFEIVVKFNICRCVLVYLRYWLTSTAR